MAYKVQFKTPILNNEWNDLFKLNPDDLDSIELEIFDSKKSAQKQIESMRYDGDEGNDFRIVEIVELVIVKDVQDKGDEWQTTSYNVIDLVDGSFSGRGDSFSKLKDAVSYCKSQKVGFERRKDLDTES